MRDNKYRFYDDYEPAANIAYSLNDPGEDYELVAPYRDILGILESEQAWSEEDAIASDTILQKIKEWDKNERDRVKSPPKTTRTVRNQLNNLYNGYVVFKIKGQRGKSYYWKHPDEKIQPPTYRRISRFGRNSVDNIEEVLCCHELTTFAVFVYILGGLSSGFHTQEVVITIVSFMMFITGLIMSYLDRPLFP